MVHSAVQHQRRNGSFREAGFIISNCRPSKDYSGLKQSGRLWITLNFLLSPKKGQAGVAWKQYSAEKIPAQSGVALGDVGGLFHPTRTMGLTFSVGKTGCRFTHISAKEPRNLSRDLLHLTGARDKDTSHQLNRWLQPPSRCLSKILELELGS